MNDLCQHFTAQWTADALVDRYFSDLDRNDLVLDPSCGRGAFLTALPSYVPAVGIEIDPVLASFARQVTGRTIIEGDFRSASITSTPTLVLGNIPFRSHLIDQFIDRSHSLLPDGGRVGFLLPVYYFQRATRVYELSQRWSIQQELIPKSCFSSRMREALLFAVLVKNQRRLLVGFALYDIEHARQQMDVAYRALLKNTHGSMWRAVCRLALSRLGGEATLTNIYQEIEPNRPTGNPWWREKLRQTLRTYEEFEPVKPGHYRLRPSSAAREESALEIERDVEASKLNPYLQGQLFPSELKGAKCA